jgi:hypothetical protein
MWCVYEVDSTRYAGRKGQYGDPVFASVAAAKSHIARLVKSGKYTRYQITFSPYAFFKRNIEKQVVRKNLLSGQEFTESVNTPHYCSPASESYWSM